MKLTVTVLLVAVFLYSFNACQNSKKTGKSATDLTFETIQRGVLKGAGEEGFAQEVIKVTSSQELKEVLKGINSVNKEIDLDFIGNRDFFDEYMLLFVFDKARGTGGYKLKVNEVKAAKKEITLKVYIKTPGEIAPSVMTQPYEVIQLEKSEKLINASFIEQ